MYLEKNDGYSLIEVIIVIVIIGIAITLAGYGFNLINRSNVNGYINEFHADVRYAKNNSMSLEDESFYIQWAYDSVDDQYYYEMYKSKPSVTPDQLLKTVKIHKTIVIKLDNGTGFALLNTYTADQIRISFESGSGDLVDGKGKGEYEFYLNDDTSKIVEIIESTGRVFVNE